MAAAAGVVTKDPTVFDEMAAAGSPPEIHILATACRALIFDVLPETVEVVWPAQRSAGYGTGPKKMSEQFCWLAPAGKHVVFGFCYGTELPDPQGILEGTGALMRHVKIRTLDNLRNPALRNMLKAAVKHQVPPVKRMPSVK